MSKNLYSEQDFERRSGAPSINCNDGQRTAFQKDYSRLLHSSSFRRLQGKTQLFPGNESDFFRNRLTHSLEVAQIAGGIVDVLNANIAVELNRELVQFAAIAHDLGHPPFGHNGEHALDELMRKHGGFEGNAQTLHILACSERKLVTGSAGLTSEFGLDLTYRTLASVLKYDNEIPVDREAKKLIKGYFGVEAELVREIKSHVCPDWTGTVFKTVECGIMDIADDIAYSTYDLEDSLHAGFVTPFSLLAALFTNDKVRREVIKKTNEALEKSGYELLGQHEIFEVACKRLDVTASLEYGEDIGVASIDAIRRKVYESLVNIQFAASDLTRTKYTAERVGELIQEVEITWNDEYPALSIVRLSRKALLDVEIFKHLNFELVIRSPKLAVVQHRGKQIVTDIFDAIVKSEGQLLPNHWRESFEACAAPDEEQSDNAVSAETPAPNLKQMRIICDFVAGMTDRYAVEFHDSLFGDGKGLYGPT